MNVRYWFWEKLMVILITSVNCYMNCKLMVILIPHVIYEFGLIAWLGWVRTD